MSPTDDLSLNMLDVHNCDAGTNQSIWTNDPSDVHISCVAKRRATKHANFTAY